MGQRFILLNITKKQKVFAHDIDIGYKLMEQIGFEYSMASVLLLLVANSNGRGGGDAPNHWLIGTWAGDSIVFQGDYANETDNGFVPHDDEDTYTNISNDAYDMLKTVYG